MAYLSPATLFAWADFHLHIVTIRNHRGGIFTLKNYLTKREFRSGKADWDDQNLSGPSGTLKINTCRLRTSWAPKLHDHLHFLNFRFHCPPLSQLDLIHLLFVLHGCTQHHQIVATTHIFVSELNKLDQVYCAWLIKLVVKWEIIQLAELCLEIMNYKWYLMVLGQ